MKNGVLITPSITSSILESITRSTVIKLAEENLNIRVEERDVERTELYTADEVFLCGSAMEVVAILKIDSYKINCGHVGLITEQVQKKYMSVVRGLDEEYLEWLTPIYN
jgi:branched-chain amino acid aminotransferase